MTAGFQVLPHVRLTRAKTNRFPMQHVRLHDTDYVPSTGDVCDTEQGRAVLIRGEALAKAELICKWLGAWEVFWYYARQPDSPVIEDVILEEQRVSMCHCTIEAEHVPRAARVARRRGLVIAGGGHSHGGGSLFSSWTDVKQMAQFGREGVGITTSLIGGVPGEVVPGPHHDGQRTISLFSTSTNRGEHMFPTFETTWCPLCTGRRERHIRAAEVTVHVIGPIRLDREERKSLREDVRTKVSVRRWDDDTSKDEAGER
jgi:hypothetical protein